MLSRRLTLFVLGVVTLAQCAPAQAQCLLTDFASPEARSTDRLGFKVALAGDSAVIAVPFENLPGDNAGSVFVLDGSASGWQQTAKLTLPSPTTGDGLGWSLAAVDNRLYAGSFARRSVFVFERADAGWALDAALMHNSPLSNDGYPWSVAAHADRVVAGAPLDEQAGFRAGAAYVFERDPNGAWSQAAKLLGAESSPGDKLGTSVAISGDVVVSGAPESDESGTASGSAYVFERDPNGSWRETAKLRSRPGHGLQLFGQSVAVDDGVILIGAYGDATVAPRTGAVYVYERDAQGAWVEMQRLAPPNGQTGDFFGISVAMDGDLAIVGAENYEGVFFGYGAAFIYHRQPDGFWDLVGTLRAEDPGDGDEFGRSVALHGRLAVVGAPFADLVRPNGNVAEDAGAAYVFAVGPDLDGDGIMDACICPGDVDGDFTVNFTDLATVLHNFGQVDDDPDGGGDGDGNPACLTWPTRCLGDLDRDGDVDISDLGILLANWASVCP